MSDLTQQDALGLDDGDGLADLYPGPPSFVRQIRSMGPNTKVADCFEHWAPRDVTGDDQIDFTRGRQHCAAAIAFSRELGTASFLLFVVMAMQGRPLRAIERGFIAGLVPLALSGRLPSPVSDEIATEVALTGADIPTFRAEEDFMSRAIRGGSAMPELFFRYTLELVAGPRERWAGGAVYMLAGAAMNGALN